MEQYYYHNGTDKFGPFSKEELHAKGVTLDTQVWCEGMPEWTAARNIPALNALLSVGSVPPIPPVPPVVPPIRPQQPTQNQIPPASNLIWGILTTIFCCLPFGVVSIVYAAKVESTFFNGNVTMAKEYSRLAGRWAIVSASVGVVVLLIYLLAVGADLFLLMNM